MTTDVTDTTDGAIVTDNGTTTDQAAAYAHAGHDHAGHAHDGHDHAGHDHDGHDHHGHANGDERRSPFADLPLDDDGMPSVTDLHNALRAVVDPEIGYNIVDLGLVYEVTKPDRGLVHIRMTLTTMGCPLTEVIHQQCSVILGAMPGVDHVDIEFTFSPPWSVDMMADYVREELRAMGMNV